MSSRVTWPFVVHNGPIAMGWCSWFPFQHMNKSANFAQTCASMLARVFTSCYRTYSQCTVCFRAISASNVHTALNSCNPDSSTHQRPFPDIRVLNYGLLFKAHGLESDSSPSILSWNSRSNVFPLSKVPEMVLRSLPPNFFLRDTRYESCNRIHMRFHTSENDRKVYMEEFWPEESDCHRNRHPDQDVRKEGIYEPAQVFCIILQLHCQTWHTPLFWSSEIAALSIWRSHFHKCLYAMFQKIYWPTPIQFGYMYDSGSCQ